MSHTPGASRLPLIWSGGVGVGAAVSAWLGAPLSLTGLLALVLLIPGAVSLLAQAEAQTIRRIASQHEHAVWALGLAAAAAITGGIVSPLCGLFILMPLIAALQGDRQRAIDAAILGAIGYGCLVLVDRFVALPGLPPWAWPLAVFPIAAALVWVTAAALLIHRPTAADTATTARQSVSPRIVRALDADGPICAIELSPLGRVQSLSGNTALLPMVKPGQMIELMVAAPGREAFARRLAQRGDVRLTLANGEARRLYIRPHTHGTSIFAVPAENELRAIEAAQQAGDSAVKARNLFFASLSHDLKTPLNAILGFADMMRAQLKGPMPDAYRDYAGIIHESGEDLMLLVEDILDLAKADAGRQTLEIEPIDLAASGRSVLRQVQVQAERRGVELAFEADPDAWAMADARAVRQIWQNLLSNAVKYSSKGQTVRVTAMRVGEMTELCVEDTGEGMDAADLATIAEPFAQGRNAAGRPGTGLGLTVVRRFADLMGGDMTITSAKGQGTRVRVSLPPANPADYAPLEDAAE